jgi:arylsulfatase A-like enzyme
MDIAPTLLETLSVENDLDFDGKVLSEVIGEEAANKRE